MRCLCAWGARLPLMGAPLVLLLGGPLRVCPERGPFHQTLRGGLHVAVSSLAGVELRSSEEDALAWTATAVAVAAFTHPQPGVWRLSALAAPGLGPYGILLLAPKQSPPRPLL